MDVRKIYRVEGREREKAGRYQGRDSGGKMLGQIASPRLQPVCVCVCVCVEGSMGGSA